MNHVTTFFRKLLITGISGMLLFTILFQILPTFFKQHTAGIEGPRAIEKTAEFLVKAYQPLMVGDFSNASVLIVPAAGFAIGMLWKILKDA